MSFARRLGVARAGGLDETPPEALDVAIVHATVGDLVPRALARFAKLGGWCAPAST